MIRYKKVLVAFDGSEDGLKALDTAKTLTEDHGAELTVLYVHGPRSEHPVNIGTTTGGEQFMFQHPVASGSVIGNLPNVPSEHQEVVVEEEMPDRVISAAEAKLTGIAKVTYENFSGKPAEEIVNFANDHNTDLIVVGNRGIGAFKKLIRGSVSEQVSNNAKCSVLIVK